MKKAKVLQDDDEIIAFQFSPTNPKTNVKFSFKVSEVIGITFASDGETFANLKNFRQARIRVNDYMNLKEARNAAQTRVV